MAEGRTIRCLIVDDEPPARDTLRHYIEKTPLLQLEGECGNALEAFSFLQQQNVDLIFLDIHMPQLKGTELLKLLPHPPKVIFTTAHSDYALEGYELNAMDYLLKPVHFDRFLKAVNKLFQFVHTGTAHTVSAEEVQKKEPYIYLRSDRKMVKVLLNEISHIESMKDYVKVFTPGGSIITKQSIASMAAMLPEEQFIRVHRSFIVAASKITSYTPELVYLKKEEIPIGKLFRPQVLKQLEG